MSRLSLAQKTGAQVSGYFQESWLLVSVGRHVDFSGDSELTRHPPRAELANLWGGWDDRNKRAIDLSSSLAPAWNLGFLIFQHSSNFQKGQIT